MPKHRAGADLTAVPNTNDWLPGYPNPADLQFDYFKLLNDVRDEPTGIGQAPLFGPTRVAIVGAGVAGLTAARELFRAGYEVTIYEASERIGGRHYTRPLPGQQTSAELGAMRFPFFGGSDQAIDTNNCLLDYYLRADPPLEYRANLSDFPNPGIAPGGTGIWINEGYGPNGVFSEGLILWNLHENNGLPQDPQLEVIASKVKSFIALWDQAVGTAYTGEDWETCWQMIACWYDQMSFSDLVFTTAVAEPPFPFDGWLGGFGMTEEEAELLYTIGSGDGSWGAFYEIGAMWFIRCVMFGFENRLQAMFGMNDAARLLYYNDQSLRDSNDAHLTGPLYRGIQALDEWLFYRHPPGLENGMYDSPNVKLFTNETVTKIHKRGNTIRVTAIPTDLFTPAGVDETRSTDLYPPPDGHTREFDHVIVSPQIWASQLSIDMVGFDRTNDLPADVLTARNEQHQITSKKIFFALREPYWSNDPSDNKIPQIIVTDTFVQDAYGILWDEFDSGGALLASYTWEDDATKLTPIDDDNLAEMVLDKLDEITNDNGRRVGIRHYVDTSVPPIVWGWSEALGYSGCAKLYRQRNWKQCYALLTYNQEYSAESHLYLAGESYDVTGGWTEAALRTAIDAVVHLIHNSQGTFNGGFDFGLYPTYNDSFSPNSEYPGGPNVIPPSCPPPP